MIAALVVFAAMFALDFVFAFYTKAIQRRAVFAASWWAVAVLACNGTVQIGYIAEHWLLIPAAVGAFGGTYSAMKWSQRRD